MHGLRVPAPVPTAFLAGFGGVMVVVCGQTGLFTPEWVLISLSALLLAYLAVEVTRLSRAENYRWLLNPVALCSLMTFVLGFGITNFLYFLPEDSLTVAGLLPGVTPWMNKLMMLVLSGAIAMWLGYWSGIARGLVAWFGNARFLQGFLKSDFTPRPGVLIILVIISLASRMIQIRLGVYGYSSEYDRLLETAGFLQYLSLTDGLGKLALIIAAFRYYSPSPARNARSWLIGLLAYELFFGFLSGFKSQVVMPFILVGVCQYLRVGRIPFRYILVVPVMLVAAYMVIEPFRLARYGDSEFSGTDISSIVSTMAKAAVSAEGVEADERVGTSLAILSRFNMTYIASLGIEHADSGRLDGMAPSFLADIFYAPFYALIPRLLWESKETSRHGLWYLTDVMGIDGLTSVGMSPFTYLYFSGGALAVIVGFFFVGVIQRVMAGVFLFSPREGAVIPFLILLPTLAMIDSVFYSLIVDLVRVLPLAIFLQHLILRR